MTDKLFASYWCVCVTVSFILFLFHKQDKKPYTVLGWKTKYVPFLAPSQHILRIFFRNGIFEAVNFKIFWGVQIPPFWRSNFSSNAFTFKISLYAPAKGWIVENITKIWPSDKEPIKTPSKGDMLLLWRSFWGCLSPSRRFRKKCRCRILATTKMSLLVSHKFLWYSIWSSAW